MQSSFREILDFVGKRDRREIESKNKNFCKKKLDSTEVEPRNTDSVINKDKLAKV
ncbi:hypothetical protein CTRC69_03625 [Chlamydia trachomatis RC-F/69]|nr:hypothetical protein CTRC69_03625 [Chlamydia trachomatis RC-F/69]AGR95969.1 hypothetical protein CTRC852_03670 [Chlamydia trachomatis RC-F(s)/852]AGR99687.1 hypothetical protein CTRC342_03655 [Chlamydia trachomatis RC-F(s)/342]AGT64903.1 hypothetical protein O169_03780 [Chlamydia trachomatis]AGT67687.1 hypothetical protein O173_03775 [Chlamydia trachomatis F/11-96]CCP57366.1 hypothetical protein SOTONF3_00724 [Chlamydia trachomatis F/SotonF3]